MGLGIAAAAAALAAGHGQRGGPDRRLRPLRVGQGVRHRAGQREHRRGLSVPAAVNTTDDELHPTLTPDGRYLVFMRTKLQPKLNGDIVPSGHAHTPWLDRQTGMSRRWPGARAPPARRSPTARTVPHLGLRPHGTDWCNLKFRRSHRQHDRRPTGFTTLRLPRRPRPARRSRHARRDGLGPAHERRRVLGRTDANTGALVKGGAQRIVGLRQGPDPGADFGDAAAPVSHPVFRAAATTTRRSTWRTATTSTSRRSRSRPRPR